MKDMIATFIKDDSGATAIEYGLIAAVIGVAIIAALTSTKTGISTTFGKAKTGMA